MGATIEEADKCRTNNVYHDTREQPTGCAESQHEIHHGDSSGENHPDGHFFDRFRAEGGRIEETADHPGKAKDAEEEKLQTAQGHLNSLKLN